MTIFTKIFKRNKNPKMKDEELKACVSGYFGVLNFYPQIVISRY